MGKKFMVLILLREKAEIHLTLEQKKDIAMDNNIRDRKTDGGAGAHSNGEKNKTCSPSYRAMVVLL